MTSPEAPTEGEGSTESGEPVAGPGSAATAAAALTSDDPGGLQVDLGSDEGTDEMTDPAVLESGGDEAQKADPAGPGGAAGRRTRGS